MANPMVTALSPINCILLFFLLLCPYDGTVHGDDPGFQVLRMETMMPANVCTTSKVPSAKSLKVVHRHGPCFPSSDGQPDPLQMLFQDSLRVAYLHNRIRLPNDLGNTTTNNLGQGRVSLRAQSGAVVGSKNFVVTVGIGTPKRDQTVIFDTGSNMCWVQCKPCPSCYQQREPIFDPSASSSYRNVPFTALPCTNLPPNRRSPSARNNCFYQVFYSGSSRSSGFLATETLTLTNTTAFHNFVFGCGQLNSGFTGAAGMFGLGRSYHSLVSQAPSNLGRVFSYCLPASRSVSGHLTIGRTAVQSPAYTPMLPSRPSGPGQYFIDLLGVTVGTQRLRVPHTVFQSTGTIIDSGTMLSYLPPAAYTELRNIFRSAMAQYHLAAPVGTVDTCYDFSNVRNPQYPTITLHFAGFTSAGVNLVLKQTQIFFIWNTSRLCLAFAPTGRSDEPGIIGFIQQVGRDVIYDLDSQKIGFAAGNCG